MVFCCAVVWLPAVRVTQFRFRRNGVTACRESVSQEVSEAEIQQLDGQLMNVLVSLSFTIASRVCQALIRSLWEKVSD